LKVYIAAQSINAINVNATIVQSNVTLNVNIAGSAVTLSVNISGVSSGVVVPISIQSSVVTLNVSIVSSTVTLSVNIAGVASGVVVPISIQSSAVTLNVNISAQSVTLNTYISDFRPTISSTALLEKGTRVFRKGSVMGGSVTLYTVPSGRRAYVFYVAYRARNYSTSLTEYCAIYVYIAGDYYAIAQDDIPPGGTAAKTVAGGVARLEAGDSVVLFGFTDVAVDGVVHVLEFTV